MEVISLVKNRKHNSNNTRRRNKYPSPVQRVDDLLVAEVRLAIQIGLSDDTIIKNYHINYSQLNYIKRSKDVSFQDYYKECEE